MMKDDTNTPTEAFIICTYVHTHHTYITIVAVLVTISSF